jgi:DNA-binding NtrC family response regulator
VEYLVEKKAVELKLSHVPEVLPEAIDLLMENDWPGNVRELQNVIERELIINQKGPLDFKSFGLFNTSRKDQKGNHEPDDEHGDELDMIVANHIEKVLNKTGGRIHGEGGAAEALGINPSTLRNRMDKLGINYKKSD